MQSERPKSAVTRFRTRLLVAMMLVVSTSTALALYLAQRNVAANVERELEREFQGELAALHHVQEIRQAALVERCRSLVGKPRIHAALEDNALDLLYPSAKDELRDVMETVADSAAERSVPSLHAEFYRFLDRTGTPIAPPNVRDVGRLRPEEEKQLALPGLGASQQLGYLVRRTDDGAEVVSEMIAMPIVSTETGEVIAAIVLGFKPVALGGLRMDSGIKRGVWFDGRLHMTSLTPGEQTVLDGEVTRAIAGSDAMESRFGREIAGAPHLFFYKRLNPGSRFPPAFEVCIYPLTELRIRQRQLLWQVLGAGALLLLGGLAASHFLSVRLSRPVEKLAVDSAENLAQRERAEAALELTSGELQRAARFSADASHQLKTPVTVMRAGLEELLAKEHLTADECREISALIHQTYRLSGVIEDLLLLSRLDAGRLKIAFTPVNLSQLIEAALDDLSALPDGREVAVETDFPAALHIAGEKRYAALILQNLLENARKYNRPGGRIRIAAREAGEWAYLTVANSGRPIPPGVQDRIFERFHRGSVGENVPGYGLGLNLARELARLHQGDLRLVRSDEAWTEFEVRFRIAQPAVAATALPA
jgi:signal transduction histidine kinase